MDFNNHRIKKSLLAIGLCITTGVSLATPHGFYIHATPGSSDTHQERDDFTNAENQTPQAGTTDSTGFGWRAGGGYQYNAYIATEFGYTDFGDANGNTLAYTNADVESGTIKEYANDFTIKAMWPLADQVSPYLDLGAAYIHSNLKLSSGSSQNYHSIQPRYGAGVNFTITNHFSTGIGWDRINGSTNIPSADLLGINFNYSF